MSTSIRTRFLNSLIGKPHVVNAKGPDAFDCYHLAQYVQRNLFDRQLPDIDTPNERTWADIIAIIDNHPERASWREVPTPPGSLIYAGDGAIVLMAASRLPAHVGVWCAPERSIIHCDKPDGVMFHNLMTLRIIGWQKLRFYAPIVS